MKINSCWIEISFSSIPESLQIVGNEIGNSTMSRSCDFIKKSLKIPKGQSESSYRRRRRQDNGQKKKYKKTNNDLQNITIKTNVLK
jgi:ribosomal protein L28